MQTPASQPALPPPGEIRQVAEQVLSRSYFDLGQAPKDNSRPFLLQLIEWMIMPFRWLHNSMEGWPDVIRWAVVIVSVLVCAALIAHIVYSFVTAIRGPAARRRLRYETAHNEPDPHHLENAAELAGNSGDYISAIRLLFRAALLRIELAEKKKLRPGCTNREILRRYRSTPVSSSLERLVAMIDQKWFGGGKCEQEDYLTCRGEHARIREYAEAARLAVGA